MSLSTRKEQTPHRRTKLCVSTTAAHAEQVTVHTLVDCIGCDRRPGCPIDLTETRIALKKNVRYDTYMHVFRLEQIDKLELTD